MIKKLFYFIPLNVRTVTRHPIKYYFFTRMSTNNIQKLTRNIIYKEFLYNFRFLPREIIEHREYFKRENMGYGESAFHTLWFYLVKTYKPRDFLEIGVYRGQIISLVSLLAKKYKIKMKVAGLSPFTEEGDGVSEYISLDYLADTKDNFNHFSLEEPHLVKARSNDANGINFIKSKKWDMIYIDGNHDYEVVKDDFELCIRQLNKSGILVLDDSSLYTDFLPEKIGLSSFRGHPGPSSVFKESINNQDIIFLFGVGHLNVFKKSN